MPQHHRTERLTFPNAAGQDLAGRLEWPVGQPRAFALFAHCFTCSKDVAAATRIARELAERGIAVLRFDFTGLGNSEGDFANTTFASNVEDLIHAAEHLAREHAAPQLLVGHSLGGAAVLMAAMRLPSVRAVATLGAPSEPSHVKHLLEPAMGELHSKGEAEIKLAGRPFRIRREFVDDLERHGLQGNLDELRAALLVMHSPTDETVGIDHARALYVAAHHPKSFVALDGADHLLTERRDSEYAADVLAAWAERYLDPLPDPPPLEPGEVAVEEVDGLRQLVRAGVHNWVADEPRSVGGRDAGPDPYAHLLAGLGACTSMTLRIVAKREKLPLEGVTVRLRHRRIHAKDCEECESKQGYVDQIERELSLTGPLDPAQRARLEQVADRCPVHRTLTENQVRIETRVVAP